MTRRLYVHGFSFVELILVLILVGILAATVIPRFFDSKTYDTRAYFDRTQAMLRYAQKIAIAENRNVYVRLDGSSIALCYDSGCATTVTAASGSNSGSSATKAACTIGAAYSSAWACEAPPGGVTVTAATTFYFSPLGKPYALADTPSTSNFSQLAVAIGGDLTRTVYVEAETGYVH
jgi:MSHA pilin protein MshC